MCSNTGRNSLCPNFLFTCHIIGYRWKVFPFWMAIYVILATKMNQRCLTFNWFEQKQEENESMKGPQSTSMAVASVLRTLLGDFSKRTTSNSTGSKCHHLWNLNLWFLKLPLMEPKNLNDWNWSKTERVKERGSTSSAAASVLWRDTLAAPFAVTPPPSIPLESQNFSVSKLFFFLMVSVSLSKNVALCRDTTSVYPFEQLSRVWHFGFKTSQFLNL